MKYMTGNSTCVISASSLLHTNWSDGVLLPLLPVCPILTQRGCGEETPALLKWTGHKWCRFRLRKHLQSQKAGETTLVNNSFGGLGIEFLWFKTPDKVCKWSVTWEESFRERRAPVRPDIAILTTSARQIQTVEVNVSASISFSFNLSLFIRTPLRIAHRLII